MVKELTVYYGLGPGTRGCLLQTLDSHLENVTAARAGSTAKGPVGVGFLHIM